MITQSWIDKRRPYWDRLEELLGQSSRHGVRGLSPEELREMAFLYRQLAADLSAVRQDDTSARLAQALNGILGRAHNTIYSARRVSPILALRFLWVTYPALFRHLLPWVGAATALFLAGGLGGALLALTRPAFADSFLGPLMVSTIHRHQMWTHSLASMKPQASSTIMTNNLGVTFAIFASGITAGLGTVYLLVFNGLLMGVVATACARAQMSLDLWSFVCPHGALELPAIMIAGGAGLRLAAGLLFPGLHSRRDSIALAGREAVRLMAGVVPMLMIAGTIEGFLSPSGLRPSLKCSVGLSLFALLLFWLFGPRQQPNEQGAGAGNVDWIGSVAPRS